MTSNGGQPHRVGYARQKYRVVVTEERPGEEPHTKRIGWMNVLPTQGFLDALNSHPCWTNARAEEVTDPITEGTMQ